MSVNNESEFIDLYFYRDDKLEHVKIWQEHYLFGEVKQAFEQNDFKRVFDLSVYRNSNGYWTVSKNVDEESDEE